MHQPPYDLFGEIPVTEDDLFDWVAAVAPRWLSERAYTHYLRMYDVPGKVRRAKAGGTFDATISARQAPAWHPRLCLPEIL